MANLASQTAYGPMTVIAVEQTYPEEQRLVQDELAFQFLPLWLKAILKLSKWHLGRAFLSNMSERRGRGVWGGVLCRKRYIEEKVLEAVSEGVDSIVIMGAGLDTLAYRLAALRTIPVFEVDLPENIENKRAKLIKKFGSVPDQVSLTPIDFNSQDLTGVLAEQGYRVEHISFFIGEAVTQYLTEEGVRRIFDFLAQAQAGSRLVFTYIRKDFIDGLACYGLDYMYRAYRVWRQLWLFGMDPEQVSPFLGEYGWKELEQVGSQEYISRYLKPTGRTIPVMEIERAVYAEKLYRI